MLMGLLLKFLLDLQLEQKMLSLCGVVWMGWAIQWTASPRIPIILEYRDIESVYSKERSVDRVEKKSRIVLIK